MIGKIKGRSAKAPVIWKYVKQDLTDYQNHICSFRLGCFNVRVLLSDFFHCLGDQFTRFRYKMNQSLHDAGSVIAIQAEKFSLR